MLGAVLFISFIPLVITQGGGVESPFLFNAGWRLGTAVGCLLALLALYRPILLDPQVISTVARNAFSWALFGATINSLEYALFAWSVQFIAIPVAAVLLELWPIGFILLTARLLRSENLHRKNIHSIFPFLVIAFIGVGFVVASQAEGYSLDGMLFSSPFIGVFLALLSAVAGSLGAFTLLWGRDLARKLPTSAISNRSNTSLIFFGAVLGYAISNIFGAILNAGIGFSLRETIGLEVLTISIVGGLLIRASASVLLRISNLTTNNLGVNALGYTIPIVSLFWLAIFSQIDVPNVAYLVIGTAAIVAANLLINFEAERLLGFKVLVIALWVCGTLVYLRDVARWGWAAESDGYFDVLFLSATVFALILSFRTQRLASRTQEEDNRAFKVFRELEELARWGVISPAAYQHIPVIDEEQGRELETAYAAARRRIAAALRTAKGPNREKLIAVSVELDALAHSRQQGINFGEICALFIFAGLVVGTALLSRPAEVSRLTGFLVEMFAMVFPAVIVFLAFNVLDLQRDRISRILKHNPQYGGYGVAFQDTESQNGTTRHTSRRTVEQWISVVVGLTLIVAYAGLFVNKWEVWPLIVAWFTGLLS